MKNVVISSNTKKYNVAVIEHMYYTMKYRHTKQTKNYKIYKYKYRLKMADSKQLSIFDL